MDLLSPQQWADFKSAIKDVTDTFHKEPITLFTNGASSDRWQEDRKPSEYDSYPVLCRVVYGTNTTDASKSDDSGEIDRTRLFITVDMRNLKAANFPIVEDRPDITIGKDYILYKAEYFLITACILQGMTNPETLLVRFEVDITKYYNPGS